MKKYLGIISTILILAIFGIYFFTNVDRFTPLLGVSVWVLLAVTALKVLTMVNRGYFYKIMFRAYKIDMRLSQGFFAVVITTIGNFFLPMQGGAGIRAIYFKRKFKFPYEKFMSTMSGIFIITFLLNAFLGLLSLVMIHILNGVYSTPLYIFFAGLFASTLALSIFEFPEKVFAIDLRFEFLNKVRDILRRIVVGWNQLIKKRVILLQLVGVIFLDTVIFMASTYVSFVSLGVNMSLLALILYASLASISTIVSLTPGSIGIREAIFMLFANIMLITNDQILQAALIDRGILFFVMLVAYVVVRVLDMEDFDFGLFAKSARSSKESNK